MTTIKSILYCYQIKMAKNKQGRTERQQEYRDNLAHKLRSLREGWDTWKDLAQTLLDKEQATIEYVEALGKWRKLNKEKSKQIANELIEKWEWWSVGMNLEKFVWLDEEIAEKLIEWCEWCFVAAHLEKFEWLDHEKIANELIEKWDWWYVAEYLEKFEWLGEEIAEKLIEQWYWYAVAENLEKFEWLDEEIAEKLIEQWYWYLMKGHPANFWL